MNFKIQIEGADATFQCSDEETLIDAAARQGISLPYSCRKGVCGNCQGHVTSGSLVPGTEGCSAETGTSSPEEHLFCKARPASDLSIRPRSWQRVDPAAIKTLSARVFRITQAADDVSILQLRFATGIRIKFRAGQYLQILLPDGQRRSYSMANAPHESDTVQLHVRHVAGGTFSDKLLQTLKSGDMLKLELPHGDFWLREDSGRPIIMVAGGTGFAPMRSMIEHMIRKQIQVPVHLFWGVRSPSSHYAADLIERWQQQLTDFKYQAVSSSLLRVQDMQGYRGSLIEAVLACGLNIRDFDVYACGALGMISSLRTVLCNDLGLSSEHFYSDAFVSG